MLQAGLPWTPPFSPSIPVARPELLILRSGSLRPVGETLTPLMEGSDPDGCNGADGKKEKWGHWMKGQISRAPSSSGSSASSCSGYRCSDLRLLLGVMGAPLARAHVTNPDPLPHLSIKDAPIGSDASRIDDAIDVATKFASMKLR